MHIRRFTTALLATSLVVASTSATAQDETPMPTSMQATTLLDLSGLVAVSGICCKGDEEAGPRMIAAHDGKNPDEAELPRISVLTLTNSAQGIVWEPLVMDWPQMEQGQPNDLESAAAIPGTSSALFVESGDDGGPFRRIFHVELALDVRAVGRVVEVVDWPVPPFNVEGSAVALAGEQLVFLFAERAQGQPSTMINWAPLSLSPLVFGEFQAVPFTSPAVTGPEDRPVSAIEVASDGTIYVASAYDSGNDDGPFSSTIWVAGRVVDDGGPRVVLEETPRLVATLDAFKTESLAIQVALDGTETLFAGTDDENYGGVLRPIPTRP
jgi:hypothetical protein